jgi:hypothetical protein
MRVEHPLGDEFVELVEPDPTIEIGDFRRDGHRGQFPGIGR